MRAVFQQSSVYVSAAVLAHTLAIGRTNVLLETALLPENTVLSVIQVVAPRLPNVAFSRYSIRYFVNDTEHFIVFILV